MDLATWYERVARTVSESGNGAQNIRLTANGQTWESWSAPWGDDDEWLGEATRLLEECAEQWPARRHQVIFVAEGRGGVVLSQCAVEVTGRSKSGASMGSPDGGFKSLTEAMDNLQRNWERTLNVTNTQLETQARIIKDFGEQQVEFFKYFQASESYRAQEQQRELEARSGREPDPLKAQIVEQLPALIEMAADWLKMQASGERPKKTLVGEVVRAAADAAVNGSLESK